MGAGHLVVWGMMLFLGAAIFIAWVLTLIIGFVGLKRRNGGMIVVGILGLAIPALNYGLWWPSTSPAQTFKSEFGILPPSGVKNLKVKGAWNDVVIYMGFEASPETITTLLDPAYKRTYPSAFTDAVDVVPTGRVLPTSGGQPDWWPKVISKTSQIYEKSNSEGSTSDQSFLVTDPSTGVTFYFGYHDDG